VDLEIDDSAWPIVVARWQGRPSDASLAASLARMDGWLARGERFGLLIDSRGGEGFTPEQRTLLVKHMKRNVERTEKYLVQAVVADNLISRTLYWGVQLLFPSPFPSKVFGNIDAARTWIVETLGRDAGRPP
jgi:hypothetical protein